MSHPSTRSAAPWITTALAVLAVSGCVPPADGTGGGGAGGGGAGGVLDGTDAQVCGAACDTLIGCGVELDQGGCKSGCLDPAGASLVACFRQVAATCDPLSGCVLGAVCGSGGIPSGSSTCEDGQGCLIYCAGNADPSCGCACMGQVTSAASAAIYAVAVCASVHCNFECGASGDPVSCESCLANECKSADGKCQ